MPPTDRKPEWNHSPAMQVRYRRFVVDLTRISRRHGVAVKSVGGVTLAEQASEYAALVYVGDITSGDLLPLWGEPDVLI
jgi:hypothetical protein